VNIQNVITAFLVTASFLYVAWRIGLALRAKTKAGCGSCGTCPSGAQEQTLDLVMIGRSPNGKASRKVS
jgi:hypothetical protein